MNKLTKEQECMRALECLYLAVPAKIADDVKRRVMAALNEVRTNAQNDVLLIKDELHEIQ